MEARTRLPVGDGDRKTGDRRLRVPATYFSLSVEAMPPAKRGFNPRAQVIWDGRARPENVSTVVRSTVSSRL